MRIVAFIVISFCLAGCVKPASKQTGSAILNSPQRFVTFDSQQIAEMKHRLQLLRPEMSKQQALSVLCLSQYEGRLYIGGASSGDTANLFCKLAEGHNLWLSYAYTADDSTRIIDAQIDDQKWRASDVVTNH